MKRFVVILVCGALLVGCNASPNTTSSTRSSPNIVASVLRAPAVGRAWDEGAKAASNNNLDGLAKAAQKLRKLGANEEATLLGRAAAENLVARAGNLDAQAFRETGATQKQLQTQAAVLYRRALEIEPDFGSDNAALLNALGYFLADRGTTKSDFALAEKLTRRALKLHEARSPLNQVFLEHLESRAAFRDSLAWALFKQGRFDQALREQKIAVADAKRATRDKTNANSQALRRELREHLAQIEAALAKTP